GVRLAYVAATRARDLLVVPAVGDAPWQDGWLGPLNEALYPPLAPRREASPGPKCPPFRATDSVLRRPNDEPAGAGAVRPGPPVFDAVGDDGARGPEEAAGGYSVVWWDPSALALGAKPPFGVRRAELIVKDVGGHVIAEARSRYDRWRLARAEAQSAGAA